MIQIAKVAGICGEIISSVFVQVVSVRPLTVVNFVCRSFTSEAHNQKEKQRKAWTRFDKLPGQNGSIRPSIVAVMASPTYHDARGTGVSDLKPAGSKHSESIYKFDCGSLLLQTPSHCRYSGFSPERILRERFHPQICQTEGIGHSPTPTTPSGKRAGLH